MAQDIIKIGFIGSGWARVAQAPAFSLMENVELSAVASPTAEHRQKFMKMFDISKGFADWQEMLHCNLDLVCVTTPTYLHREMVTGVLQSGKSVLCEKPFALNFADAADMVDVASKAPGFALIDHQLRFHPAVRCMKQMIDGGEIGKVYEVRAVVNLASRNRPDMPWSWWCDAEKGGGALGAIGSHLIDMNRFLIGEISKVSCTLATSIPFRPDKAGKPCAVTSDDHFAMMMKFGPSSVALGSSSLMHVTTVGAYTWFSFEVVGSLKTIRLDGAGRLWEVANDEAKVGRSLIDAPRWKLIEPMLSWDELVLQEKIRQSSLAVHGIFAVGFAFLAHRIVKALKNKEKGPHDAAGFPDGLMIQKVLQAARKSDKLQRWIKI
ncbi:Gfo/Idh/MocA family protein [Pelodictyon phaeoclathratiforme]|jgi:predicted dehydrogenase|uniref:Oxidoreductase domain protein n=1 Tax=Pelodictyon phaeoclathratiforme (strain DSM 5477 / BU-1) TaxID=324925 RepID=B4SEG2_PELPB|nr:Gfo/Idh/MocA family oxidoreductase [Pelodictyon phaeoclathratiforme]ACF43054.1 oxidoreductase domain protein [Pelodictyon phaeoclathratiforme BU-1]MBV5289202.1 Gfo/Idh/MocA family oxidoreductase [Pelodictyon phaeoclathratiforme]